MTLATRSLLTRPVASRPRRDALVEAAPGGDTGRRGSGLRAGAARLFVAIGLAEMGAYLLFPEERDALYLVIGLSASFAIAFGLRLHRPHRRGWILVAAGIATNCLGDAVYTYLAAASGSDPFPSFADGLYLVADLMLFAGIAALAVPATHRLRHPALLDAGLVATACGFVAWVLLLDPILAEDGEPLAASIAIAYPLFDIAFIGVLASFWLLPGRKRPAGLLLAAGLVAWLSADLIFARLSLTGDYVSNGLLDTGWLIGYVLFGVAALHPSMAHLVATVRPYETTLSNRRLGLVAATVLVPIAVFIAHGPLVSDWDFAGFSTGAAAITLLGLARLLGALHDSRLLLEQQRTLHREIDRRARTDGLTGLANRSALVDRLRAVLEGDGSVGLLFLDLDDFKRVNDAVGHPVGDDVLRVVASRLCAIVRAPDDVARLGGDEFALIVSPCPTLAGATGVAQRVLDSFAAEVVVDGRSFRIRPSIGVVWTQPGELTADEVLSRADIAMYLAKEHDGDSFKIFEPVMYDRAVALTQLRSDLQGAALRGEIEPWYQPIFDTNRRLVAVEALVRWHHPRCGLVSPAEFVPIAELSGDIVDIDRARVRMATRDVARWNAAGRSIQLHVNIAPREIADPRIVESIADALAASGLLARQLVVEVTETALVDEATVAPVLAALKDLGLRLSIDDFGSRYAVLALLGRLPFDNVKLDRSLVIGVETPEGFRLLQGIVRLADSLRLETIAEGVETASELALLQRLGCTGFQGYLLGRPVPASEFSWRFAGEGVAAIA
jgi:diguanylate cyclase (GGDEF)-like protein